MKSDLLEKSCVFPQEKINIWYIVTKHLFNFSYCIFDKLCGGLKCCKDCLLVVCRVKYTHNKDTRSVV